MMPGNLCPGIRYNAIRKKPHVIEMKEKIHPDYRLVKVTLADGSEVEMKSTMGMDEYKSDVDSTNHPFYTGRRQFVDTTGRVEKFKRRYAKKK